MTQKLVIFGTSPISELAHYYFTQDSNYEVIAFCVDSEYLTENQFCGLPVVEFETIEEVYTTDEYSLFIALSYANINALRKEKYLAAKSKGYDIASYISTKATIFDNVTIGENAFILENNTIQPFVKIGDNVTLWSGNHIGHHSTIKDHNFISSHVVVSGGVTIKESCFLGVNSTLRNDITIGDKSVIGAGAIIMEDTTNQSVYIADKTIVKKITSDRLKKI
jgi:sugar O-acyltransferase (sialic acid O-acetyltransferase NeuD family)